MSETYEIFVDDDRYAVPTLHLTPAEDEEMAVKVARKLLEDSPHHLGVEVFLDGQRLVGLGSLAYRSATIGEPRPCTAGD